MATRKKQPVSQPETPAVVPAEAGPSKRRSGPSVNRVSLIGRLTADPELRYTPSGISVTKFRLATNSAGGEAQFYPVVVWRRLAEVAAEHLSKGRLIYVSGRLQSRNWTAQDGSARYALEVVADQIQFLSPKPASVSVSTGAAA